MKKMEAKEINKHFSAHILVVDDDKRLNKLLEKSTTPAINKGLKSR